MKMRFRRLTGSITSAAFVIACAAAAPTPALADDGTWGCEVVLCLASPGGPTQYAACVPPIEQFWASLATGGGFPTCAEGGVNFTGSASFGGINIFTVASATGSPSYYMIYEDGTNTVQVEQLTALQAQELEGIYQDRGSAGYNR